LTGARVVIEGPAEFVVGRRESETPSRGSTSHREAANSGYLALGKLVARCETRDSEGFAIDTPAARVEDFGTEFGVEVRKSGAADFVVLSGEVDVIREAADGSQQRMRLTKDQAAFVSEEQGPITRRQNADVQMVTAMQNRLKVIREEAAAPVASVTARTPVFRITDAETGIEWLVIDNELEDEGEGRISRLGNWDRNVLGANTFNHIGYRAEKAVTPGTPTARTAWAFLQLAPGTYEVAVSWAVRAGQSNNAPFSINGGPAIRVDQTETPVGPPNLLEASGEDMIGYQVISTDTKVDRTGALTVELTNDASGLVLADSVAIRRVTETKSVANEEGKDTNQSPDVVSGDPKQQ
ncbi:MAG: hypothetical protein MI757_16825, partial [Pirellulales bacterium]|nr:hypothetical protein [Pirellulales bacterium]